MTLRIALVEPWRNLHRPFPEIDGKLIFSDFYLFEILVQYKNRNLVSLLIVPFVASLSAPLNYLQDTIEAEVKGPDLDSDAQCEGQFRSLLPSLELVESLSWTGEHVISLHLGAQSANSTMRPSGSSKKI